MFKVRVGIICRTLWPSGPTLNAICEAAYLSKKYHTELVILRIPARYYRYEDILKEHNIKIVYLNNALVRFLRLLSYLLFPLLPEQRSFESLVDVPVIVIFGLLYARYYDVLICTDQYASLAGAIGKLISGRNFILYIHDPLTSRYQGTRMLRIGRFAPVATFLAKILMMYERAILSRAGFVVTNSFKNLSNLLNFYPHIASKIRVIYPCIFPPKRKGSVSGKYVLAFARWEKNRHPEFVIELAKLVKVEIVLAGSWTPKSYLSDFLKLLRTSNGEMQGSVRLIADVSDEEMNNLYSKALCYILWNPESFSVGTARALMFGLPIICPRAAGISELMKDYKYGFIVEEVTPQNYAEIIKSLMCQVIDDGIRNKDFAFTPQVLNPENHAKELAMLIDELTRSGERMRINNGSSV